MSYTLPFDQDIEADIVMLGYKGSLL